MNKTPILIIDDLFDKLDRNRVERLMQWLNESEVNQLFLSDTRKGRMDEVLSNLTMQLKLIEVKNGKVI